MTRLVLAPESATEHQYEAIKVLAECMIEAGTSIDVGLLYGCGIQARPPVTDEMLSDFLPAVQGAIDHAINNPTMTDCSRCSGKGYHHGFGEDGHDPDWCSVCGGPGKVPADPMEPARAALRKLRDLMEK